MYSQQKWSTKMYIYHVIVIIFVLGEEKLPENLMTYDNHNSVCYGPGTHGQFRPSCPSEEYIILIESLKIGIKPLAKDCPSSVTKLTTHTGSYIVDTLDHTKILDEGSCCFPDEANDCIFNYNYANSGLNYYYHTSCSGYTQCKPNMEVSWAKTSCNDTSIYPSGSNYMFMNYACIERNRIGDMCSNNTYSITGSAFYLTNTDYPKSVSSSIDFCQCHVQTNGSNIQAVTVEVSLEKQGNECKQGLNISDSNGVNNWDCETATKFNITKESKKPATTVTFRNDRQEDGGQFVIGVYAAEDIQNAMLKIDCYVKVKQDLVTTLQTSSSVIKTLNNIDSLSTTYTQTSQNTEKTEVLHTPTSQNTERTEVIPTPTSQNTERTEFIHTPTSQNTERTEVIPTPTSQNTERTEVIYTPTLQNTERTEVILTPTSQNTERTEVIHTPSRYQTTSDLQNTTSASNIPTSIKQTPTVQASEITLNTYKSTLQSSESWSTMHTPTLSLVNSPSNFDTSTAQSTPNKQTLPDSISSSSLPNLTVTPLSASDGLSTSHSRILQLSDLTSAKTTLTLPTSDATDLISTTYSASNSVSRPNTHTINSAFSGTPSETTPSLESTAVIDSTTDRYPSTTANKQTPTSSKGSIVNNQSFVNKAPNYGIFVAILCVCVVVGLLTIILLIVLTVVLCRKCCKKRRVQPEMSMELPQYNRFTKHRNSCTNQINVHKPKQVHIVNEKEDGLSSCITEGNQNDINTYPKNNDSYNDKSSVIDVGIEDTNHHQSIYVNPRVSEESEAEPNINDTANKNTEHVGKSCNCKVDDNQETSSSDKSCLSGRGNEHRSDDVDDSNSGTNILPTRESSLGKESDSQQKNFEKRERSRGKKRKRRGSTRKPRRKGSIRKRKQKVSNNTQSTNMLKNVEKVENLHIGHIGHIHFTNSPIKFK